MAGIKPTGRVCASSWRRTLAAVEIILAEWTTPALDSPVDGFLKSPNHISSISHSRVENVDQRTCVSLQVFQAVVQLVLWELLLDKHRTEWIFGSEDSPFDRSNTRWAKELVRSEGKGQGLGRGGGGVAGDQSGIGVMEKGKAEEESEKRCGKIEYRLRKNGRITMTLIYLVLKLSARVTFWVAISWLFQPID